MLLLEVDTTKGTKNAQRIEGRQLSIRIAQDVLDWFRQQGKGYQTKSNAVLQAYVRAHQR